MNEYPKINTIFKRDMATSYKSLLEGQYSLPEFEYLAGNQWVFTEKVDGTNIRVMMNNGAITFGGKTDAAQLPSPLARRLAERFLTTAGRAKMEEVFNKDACLYGEGYGPKIQKGGEKYRWDQDFVLFDIKVGPFWLRRDDIVSIAEKLGLDVVPVIGEGTLNDAVDMAKKGFKSTWGDFNAEGIVMRTKVELKSRMGDRMITKIKLRDFAV